MNFNDKRELNKYLNSNCCELGFGSQGTVYYDKKTKKAVKIFHAYGLLDFDTNITPDYFLKFNVKNDTYIFPEEIVMCNGLVVGYTCEYVNGKHLYTVNPLKVKLNEFEKAIEIAQKDTDIISKNGIKVSDILYNILLNDKIKVIDPDAYSKVDKNIDKIRYTNQGTLSYVIKLFLVDSYFNEFVYDDRLLRELYRDDEVSSLEFLREFRKVLSEYANKDINTLNQAKKCLNKKVRLPHYERAL